MSRGTILLNFLKRNNIESYHPGLECQVMVAQEDGEKTKYGFKNNQDEWYHFRINSLEQANKKLTYSLDKYVEAIGLSGWNFRESKSEWVGFDFDSIVGHKKGLSDQELQEILDKASGVSWLTIKKSTSGRGLHFYVPISESPKIATRKEHVLLSKHILSILSGLLKFDFRTKVDTCGTILWVWHRKATNPDSFKLIKEATTTYQSPANWSDYKDKFRGKPQELAANIRFLDLTLEQENLLKWFAGQKCSWWWDAELSMLVCHTHDLLRAHKELQCKGMFFTAATGESCPNDYNAFAFPLKSGAWIVRRYNPGCKEHTYWQTDKAGWTYCFFNKVPSLSDIASIYGGMATEKKEVFAFKNAENIAQIIAILAPSIRLFIPPHFQLRQFKLKSLSDARLSISVEREKSDPDIEGWVGHKSTWEKVLYVIQEDEIELTLPDNLIRHVVTAGKNAGWFINAKGSWIEEPKDNIHMALVSMGHNPKQVTDLMGQCIFNNWTLVNHPFEGEYPGNRQWNKYAAKLAFEPQEGKWDNWQLITDHIGKGLDESVKTNNWCLAYGVETGGQYIRLWIASLFKHATEPLPYLFLYGPQLSGKSSFYEALELLIAKGVKRSESALINPSAFNAELLGVVLCSLEEINLKKIPHAYERIKDWVTSRKISIHEKGKTPFDLPNTTHWIHCANSSESCPIILGDTRITMVYVDLPKTIRPKEKLFEQLTEEAPAFLYHVLNLEVPPAVDRLRIPIIQTGDKTEEQLATANLVEQFILQQTYRRRGRVILFKDFCIRFHLWLEAQHGRPLDWPVTKIARSIPLTNEMPIKGRFGGTGDIYLGNISFNADETDESFILIKSGERLTRSIT